MKSTTENKDEPAGFWMILMFFLVLFWLMLIHAPVDHEEVNRRRFII